jgi:hypothetical protein
MTQLEELIQRAERRAQQLGGLLAILLLVRKGMTTDIKWKGGNFVVNNKMIDPKAMNIELNRIELKIAHVISSYNEKLLTGNWKLEKWQTEMAKLVGESHVLFGALAIGSIAAAASSDLVLRKIQRDLQALTRFSDAIKSGKVKTHSQANHRGRAYIFSAFVTFHLLSQQNHIKGGYTHAKRILTHAEHCRTGLVHGRVTEGCYEAAGRGWMPIMEMPPIGVLVCQQFCKCFLIYSKQG